MEVITRSLNGSKCGADCFLQCIHHRTDPQVAVHEVNLGAADAGRTIATQRRHRQVLARGQKLADLRRKLRLRRLELSPTSPLAATIPHITNRP